MQLNVVVVYFASGVEASDNEWNITLWGELANIVASLQSAGKAIHIIGDSNVHIEIQNLNVTPLFTKKPTDAKHPFEKLLKLCASQKWLNLIFNFNPKIQFSSPAQSDHFPFSSHDSMTISVSIRVLSVFT